MYHDVRTQTVDILDGNTNAVLDSKTISAFPLGRYMIYNTQGRLKNRITLIIRIRVRRLTALWSSGLILFFAAGPLTDVRERRSGFYPRYSTGGDSV